MSTFCAHAQSTRQRLPNRRCACISFFCVQSLLRVGYSKVALDSAVHKSSTIFPLNGTIGVQPTTLERQELNSTTGWFASQADWNDSAPNAYHRLPSSAFSISTSCSPHCMSKQACYRGLLDKFDLHFKVLIHVPSVDQTVDFQSWNVEGFIEIYSS